uniref:Uncharacterized protein n=1 Tax=Aegilops tauschii subsp. strangulata TaxID=200361 RepID=A0A453S7A2_AEGTS
LVFSGIDRRIPPSAGVRFASSFHFACYPLAAVIDSTRYDLPALACGETIDLLVKTRVLRTHLAHRLTRASHTC